MNYIWTSKSLDQYDQIIHFLMEKWGVKVSQEFIDDLYRVLRLIEKNNNLAPISNSRKYLRKAIINKYNYLLYHVDGNDIVLIDIGSNRMNN